MLTITTATPSDAPTIAAILEELDRFYGVTEFVSMEQRVNQITPLLFRERPVSHVLLAWEAGSAIGLASYSFLWPAAGITSSLYLKELYVMQAHRKRGVGRALMSTLSKIASDNGCSRIEWTTERHNADARRFYESLGVPVVEEKVFYRAEGDLMIRIQHSPE